MAAADLIAGQPQAGDLLVVIGDTQGHLGQSALLAEAFGIEAGPPPPVDLAAEIASAKTLLANRKLVQAARDLGDGGLALTAFRMADAAGLGLMLRSGDIGQLFGEDQARYLVAIRPGDLPNVQAQGVRVTEVGTLGGDTVTLGTDTAPLAELSKLYRTAFATALGV
ncbi:MAG: hypothetical protein B7Z31_12450 [Rhodobacterales bacterium 12-65-15]|nr:MAG: hypothetical protein B7Z31_12450 [Rhodobacterales bacterium 12-65-15]